MTTARFFVLFMWFVLVSSASLISVPFIGLISWLLVPAAAIGLVFSVLRISGRPSFQLGAVMSAVATLLLAGVAAHCALTGSWWLLARQREVDPGSNGVWLLMACLNVLGAIVFAVGNELRLGGDRRTNVFLTAVVGSAPIATLMCLFVVSRVMPLSA